jgi:hypothetical protein
VGARMGARIAEKWKTKTKQLFDFFCEKMTESEYKFTGFVHPVFDPQNIKELFAYGTTDSDLKQVIEFSIQNWDKLRHVKRLGRMSIEPSFTQIVSTYKFSTLFEFSKQGIEAEETATEEDGFVSDEARRLYQCIAKNKS